MPTSAVRWPTVRWPIVLGVLLAAAPAGAAPLPWHPEARPAPGVHSAVQTPGFECGTYRGNELQSIAQYHRWRAGAAVQGGADGAFTHEVYDDVWIIEDNGSLTFSGLNAFDTDNSTFHYEPNAEGGYDVSEIAFTFDPLLGTSLGLGDDTNLTQALGFPFPYFGSNWADVHINSNGIVGFGADVNPSGFFSSDDFFSNIPKISPFFIDLNPAAGGAVRMRVDVDRAILTWNNVPEFGTANLNTIQLVLHDTGAFDVTFNGINSNLSSNGLPITFGIHPGGTPELVIVDYSTDLPFSEGAGHGVYETYQNIVNPRVNEVALLNEFYQHFSDDYFQVVFFTNFVQTMGGFANELNIRNDVQGIGLGLFDNSALYGSAVLESRCNMNRLAVWPLLPETRFANDGNSFLTIMGQEAGHRWGAFVQFEDSTGAESNLILGRADAHWSYYVDVDHSSLEGGNWEPIAPMAYECPTQIDFFSQIDEYLFGIRRPAEVSPIFYISSLTNDQPQNRAIGTPPQGAQAQGTKVVVTLDDIVANEGPRVPAERPQKDLRQAFILLLANGTTATQAQKNQITGFRRAWEDYFERSVDGRFAVNTRITSTFPVGVLKGTVTDAGTGDPIPFTARALERAFVQTVPDSGRYEFRFMADAASGAAETTTVVFQAEGYYPDTLVCEVPYDSTVCKEVALDADVTAVGEDRARPALPLAVQNPVGLRAEIAFVLPEAAPVRLEIFDIGGRRVAVLQDALLPAGPHRAVWDRRDTRGIPVAAGLYFVRLAGAGTPSVRKIVVLTPAG